MLAPVAFAMFLKSIFLEFIIFQLVRICNIGIGTLNARQRRHWDARRALTPNWCNLFPASRLDSHNPAFRQQNFDRQNDEIERRQNGQKNFPRCRNAKKCPDQQNENPQKKCLFVFYHVSIIHDEQNFQNENQKKISKNFASKRPSEC